VFTFTVRSTNDLNLTKIPFDSTAPTRLLKMGVVNIFPIQFIIVYLKCSGTDGAKVIDVIFNPPQKSS